MTAHTLIDPEVVAEFERREAYRIRHNAKVPTYGVSWSGLTGGERIGPTTWEECEEAIKRRRAAYAEIVARRQAEGAR